MSITKADVEKWIKEIVPYVIHPIALAPKGALDKGLKDVQPGGLLEYETTLIPGKPEILDQTVALKVLVDMYNMTLINEPPLNEEENQAIKDISLDD